MKPNSERRRLFEKMFEAALKEKMNQLARKYDYNHVFELWARIARIGEVKTYFCKWRWEPEMTLREAMDCLEDYFAGLEALLQKRLLDAEVNTKRNGRRTREVGKATIY